jgi:hypothetical protein
MLAIAITGDPLATDRFTHMYFFRSPRVPVPQHPQRANMTYQTPRSVAERRLAIARRLYEALVTQDPDRAITLHDGGGRVVARHDPPPEQLYGTLTRHCGKLGLDWN